MRLAVVSVLVFGACGRASPRSRFATEALPILERRCAAAVCHGVGPDAPAIERATLADALHFEIDARGRVHDVDAAYEVARARINTEEAAAFSSLLRKTLPREEGGLPHLGGVIWSSTKASDYVALRGWVEVETRGGEAPESLSQLEVQFRDTVQPVLSARGCMIATCHGPLGFGGMNFQTPLPEHGFSAAMTRANHREARRELYLGGGDPTQSRLLRKALPLGRGGIAHKGGNDTFFPAASGRDPSQDPGVAAIVSWAEAERSVAVGPDAPRTATALLFVRGPIAPRAPADLEVFRPGSDVFVLEPVIPGVVARNLTAQAHEGLADVRDPAPSHDGRRVAFSMRRSASDCARLFEVGLDGSGLRPLTDGPCALPGGHQIADTNPVYASRERLVFVSNRAAEIAESGRGLNTDLYDLDLDTLAVRRRTFTPGPELRPSMLAVGEFAGTVAFTVERMRDGRARSTIFRFPLDHNPSQHLQPEYHVHFGGSLADPVSYALRELPDGRDAFTLLGPANVWEGGKLALLERQFGPEVPEGGGHAALPGFRHAVTILDPAAAAGGISAGGLWRDPAALPDGRLVVAHAPGAVDLDDPSARPDTRLEILTLAEDGGSYIASRQILIDEPGLAETQPAPVVVRPPEDGDHPDAWDPTGATPGRLRHAGVEAASALVAALAPVGVRAPSPRAASYRMLAWTAPTAGSSGLTLAPRAPAWILPEVPSMGDDSLWLSMPARRAIRLQALDETGMAIGVQHEQWLAAAPGETLPQGVRMAAFGVRCAGCHGGLGGVGGDPFAPGPDALSGASATYATHEQRNPRRPREPWPVLLDESRWRIVDFPRDVQPILDRSCAVAGCHAPPGAAGGVRLEGTADGTFSRSYRALVEGGWIDAAGTSARRSRVIERIFGRELDAPAAVTGVCPPAGASVPALDDAGRRVFVEWIESGAAFHALGHP